MMKGNALYHLLCVGILVLALHLFSDAVTAAEVDSVSAQVRGERLEEYTQIVNLWRFLGPAVRMAALAAILFTGLAAGLRNLIKRVRYRTLATGLFVVLLFLVDYALRFPFRVYRGYIVELDFGFLNQSFTAWLCEDLLSLLVLAVLVWPVVGWLYWCIARWRGWWLVFTTGFAPFLVVMVVVFPVVVSPLFNRYEPLQDRELATKILHVARRAGVESPEVLQVDASRQSTRVNAYVTGLFGSKRIVLYDTLLDNFTEDEVLYVVGHELIHYVRHHVWQGTGVALLMILFGLGLVALITPRIMHRYSRRFGFVRLTDIASLPLILLVARVVWFVVQPIPNAFSRHLERQCDIEGMRVSDTSVETAVRTLEKLGSYNLSDPGPHPVIEFWFYDHPSCENRIKLVKSYQE
jgi:STE24 endopeptidase